MKRHIPVEVPIFPPCRVCASAIRLPMWPIPNPQGATLVICMDFSFVSTVCNSFWIHRWGSDISGDMLWLSYNNVCVCLFLTSICGALPEKYWPQTRITWEDFPIASLPVYLHNHGGKADICGEPLQQHWMVYSRVWPLSSHGCQPINWNRTQIKLNSSLLGMNDSGANTSLCFQLSFSVSKLSLLNLLVILV